MVSIQVDRLDGLSSSTAVKGPCRVATTENITLSDLQTIDGVALADGDRVLVRAQTDAKDNGIYVASTGNWRRSKDFSSNRDVRKGTMLVVTDGDVHANSEWIVTTENPVVFDTSSITFIETIFIYGDEEVKTANYTMTVDDNRQTIVANSASPITFTLPEAADADAAIAGQLWEVRVFNAGAGTLTVDGAGAETINGSASIDLQQNVAATLWTNGTNWRASIIELADGAVTADKLASEAVTDPKVADSFKAKIVGAAADRTALAAMSGDTYLAVHLMENGREGVFEWSGANLSAAVSIDTLQGIYVAPASDTTGASGAWVRQFDGFNYWTKWFGAVADYSTNNTAVINTMLAVGNIQNTSLTAGRQTAFFVNVEGGVKFASRDISWLPTSGWIFAYINYFVNSDTTQGAPVSGRATNERIQLSVNSGYPNDSSGGYVGETFFSSPLHPAQGVDVHKRVDNSIAVHAGPNQAIQPDDSLHPARASVAFIKDEGFSRFSLTYLRYGSLSAYNGILVYVHQRKTNLVGSGFTGAGAWGANVPVAGDVVRGMTSLSRYVVYDVATTDIIKTEWLSGTAVPGEKLMRERAIFKGSISGTTLTVTEMFQGTIAVGHTIVGMYSNNGITASTTITALGTGAGGTGTYTVSNSQTVAGTEIVAGYVSANNIQGGGVVNILTSETPIQFGLDGWMYSRDTTFHRSKVALQNGAAGNTATLSNAPISGDPSKWLKIDDNGTARWIPAW